MTEHQVAVARDRRASKAKTLLPLFIAPFCGDIFHN